MRLLIMCCLFTGCATSSLSVPMIPERPADVSDPDGSETIFVHSMVKIIDTMKVMEDKRDVKEFCAEYIFYKPCILIRERY